MGCEVPSNGPAAVHLKQLLRLAMHSSFSCEPPYRALQGDGIGYANIGRILEAAMAEGYSVEVGGLQQFECTCACNLECVCAIRTVCLLAAC